MLNNYGIKHTGTYTSQFGIMKMTLSGWKKNEDPGTKMSWTLVDEIRQRQWVNQPETLKPFSFAPHEAPWVYVSAPYQWRTDVQKTVQILRDLKKSSNPLIYLDLETTATDIGSDLFNITEIAMLKSRGLSQRWDGPGPSVLNLAVKPSKERAAVLMNLIDRADKGQSLTKDQRYAIASLMRYAGDTIDPITKSVKRHSDLFSTEVLSKPFTKRQIEAMKSGLLNLQRNGIAEAEIIERIKNFASDLGQGKVTIVGHNILNFDLPALQKVTNNKQRWSDLISTLNNPDILDTLSMYRMYRSDHSKLYRKLIFNNLVNTKYAGKVITPSRAKQIAKETREIMKRINLRGESGPYSLDAIRNIYRWMKDEATAHMGVVDVLQLEEMFVRSYNILYPELLRAQKRGVVYGPATSLSFIDSPMEVGQKFLVFNSQRGTGFDFTMDAPSTVAALHQQHTSYALSRGVYEFQGFYQDKIHDKDVYIAKFFDPGARRYSFVTGETPEELRIKLQRGSLKFLGDSVPENLADYPEDVLHDYARRRWDRWGNIAASKGFGWEQMERFFDALDDPSILQSTTELRDFELLRPKLEAEREVYNILREQAKGHDLTRGEKTYVLSLFDQRLNELYGKKAEEASRRYPWRQAVYIFGTGESPSGFGDPGIRVSLGESFVSQVDRIIESRIKDTALEPQIEITKDILLKQMAKELDEAYGLEGRVTAASRMALPYRERLNKIRNILLDSQAALEEVNYNRLVSRDLSALRREEVQQLAAEVINKAKKISRSIDASLFEGHPHQERIMRAAGKLFDAYQQQGFGVGLVNVGGHVKMVLTPGDRDAIGAMESAFKNRRIPDRAIVVDVPTLSELGNIIYGREHKIGTRGFVRGGKEVSLYDDIIDTIAAKARIVRALADFESGDLSVPQRVLRKAVRDRLELASGLSRSGTYDRYEEAFRLDLRGNDMDLFRQTFINIREMAEEFTGKEWDELGLYEIIDYISNFKHKAITYYPGERWAQQLTVTGTKDQASLLRGIYGTQDARDYTTFGHMMRSLRPNVVQWLNYYPYSADDLRQRIAEKGIKGISINPYILSETGAKTYSMLSRAGSPIAKGVSVGALEMSSEDIVYVLTSERGMRVLKKYGLSPDEVLATLPGTWEQGGVLSPEMRGLLDAVQPKDFEVSASTISDLGDPVKRFMSGAERVSAADGSVIYTGRPVDVGLDDVLFTERVMVRGEDVLVPTLFRESGGELGKITQVTEFVRDGERFYRISTDVSFPMDEATKLMYDTRKLTANYFGIHSGDFVETKKGRMTKAAASSRAFHELFGENVHMLYLTNRAKHLDIGADLSGRLRAVAEQLSQTEEGRRALRRELEKSFGRASITQIPGVDGYSIVIPDATELMKSTTPEYTASEVDRIISTLSKKFDLDLGDVTIGNRHFRRNVVELRRALINEQRYIADWMGDQRRGVKITPREIASLKIKGMVMGVDMEPILNYLRDESLSRSNYKQLQEIASSMVTAIGALTRPDELSKLPLYTVDELAVVPALKHRSWYLKKELAGTIVGMDKTFALSLPKGFSMVLDGGVEISEELPVPMQLLKASDFSGKVYLDEQAKALVRVQEALMTYNSFLERDAPHGRAESVEEAIKMLESAITDYVDALARDVSYSHGRLIEDVMSYRLPTSGYVKAQNISARIVDSAAMTGEVRISRDLAIEMFGSPDVSPEVWRRLEGDGWYSIVRRDPNEAHWNFAVAKYKIDDNMGPRTARLSAVDAALMGADFDGDQIALLSPYSKRIADMDPSEVAKLQLALSKIHKRQVEFTLGVQDVIREAYEKESKTRAESTSKEYISYLRDALTEQGGQYSLSEFMWGGIHEEQAMLARIAKGSAGPLYNVAHMYREAGLAIYGHSGDMQRLELIDALTFITTEPFALQSKHGGKTTETLLGLLGDLSRGRSLDHWVDEFAEAIPDQIAASWSQGRDIARSLGAERFIDLDKAGRKVYKTEMARQALEAISHMRASAEISGFAKYFDPDAVPARMFYSERAYNKHFKRLGQMHDEFLRIDPGNPEFMKSFVPTETWRHYAQSTGQLKAFEAAEEAFRKGLRMAQTTRLDDLVEPVVRDSASLASDLATSSSTSIWRKIPSKVKWAAAGLGALYVLGRGLSTPPEPEEVPADPPASSPEAIIALNNPDEAGMYGRKITVKAKNLKSINLDQVQEAVQRVSQNFGGQGNINIQQRDDTSTLSTSWIQNMFARAIKNGRA